MVLPTFLELRLTPGVGSASTRCALARVQVNIADNSPSNLVSRLQASFLSAYLSSFGYPIP